MTEYQDKIIFVSGYGKILFADPNNFLPNNELNIMKLKIT